MRHNKLYAQGALRKLKRRVQKKRMSRAALVSRRADIHYLGCVICQSVPANQVIFGIRV